MEKQFKNRPRTDTVVEVQEQEFQLYFPKKPDDSLV